MRFPVGSAQPVSRSFRASVTWAGYAITQRLRRGCGGRPGD
jgi:hypothetical protein